MNNSSRPCPTRTPWCAGYAAQLLGIGGGTEVVPFLAEALQSGSPSARRAAVETLGDLGDAAALTRLAAELPDTGEETRSEAARSLGKLGTAAAWSLRKNGDSSTGPALLPLLDDESGPVRREAARSLGRLRERRAVPRLLRALSGLDETVRERAGHCGQCG